ncbi:MAG TPA: VCBS repeat-containing protein [Puia sp.]|nr:VCBS repeat-containing protein [Puia sp.]
MLLASANGIAQNGPPSTKDSWVSPDHYRVVLAVDQAGVHASSTPVSVDIDFTQRLREKKIHGNFDKNSMEVIAFHASGKPVIFDSSRSGYEKFLLPCRIDEYYGMNKVTLNFVLPGDNYTYMAYFDTKESGLGKPKRYPGLIGDGDRFTEGYKRREINASGYDCFADIDGDGDLDLFKGGTEPYIHCYENVGKGRFIDRGKLSSGGQVFVVPHDGLFRSWHSVSFFDWDGDGDQDMFIYQPTGPTEDYTNQVSIYENTTVPGGQLCFTYRGKLTTQLGKSMGSTIRFADLDGDGKTDVFSNRGEGLITFYKNISPSKKISDIRLAEGTYLKANGLPIHIWSSTPDFADIDGDGDLDLFSGTEDGPIYFFENVGSRTTPVFAIGRIIAFYEYMDLRSGVKVADFDGDGLLDFVAGRYWERTQWGEQPRMYGKLYKNIGTPTAPKFEARDAYGGAPYTEQFQIADAVRQNSVRVVDWNNDGKPDLIAGDTDGYIWYFQNTTNQKFPVFAGGKKLYSNGKPVRVYGEWNEGRAAGYARPEICDWNNDGRKDLLVADGRGWLFLYLNQGTDKDPVLGPGARVYANGKPIDGTARGSVVVCDWDNDGKKDIIFGMIGDKEFSEYYDWPHLNSDPSKDMGFLFYKNIGTDAKPVLGFPKWIRAGPDTGKIISYSRPNLGDFVDWDGDGKKDLIACEFEKNARVYINTGSGGRNEEPQFKSSAAGIKIVEPATIQMMSGADAVDFNGDGDIDIVTGQGHGASGLRFYERSYIDNTIKNIHPFVKEGIMQINKSLSHHD